MIHASKAFTEVLNYLSENPKKCKKYLADKRPSQQEKKIIQAGLFLRDNQFKKVVEILTSFTCNDPYIESQRLLMIGIAHNNRADYINGISLLEESYRIGMGVRPHQRDFITLYSLFISYVNTQNLEKLKEVLSELNQIGSRGTIESIGLSLCNIQFHLLDGDLELALEKSDNLKDSVKKMNEHQAIFFFMARMNLFLQLGNIKDARECFVALKPLRKYRTSSNFNFMKLLFQYLEDGKALYVKEKDFKDSPELLQQIIIIKAITEDKVEIANQNWILLQKNNSKIYGKPFNFLGKENLFSTALKKALKGFKINKNLVEFNDFNHEEKLLNLLRNNSGPLSKELIFEFVFKSKIKDKNDFMKLSRLVYKVKASYQVEIKTAKGCYILIKK